MKESSCISTKSTCGIRMHMYALSTWRMNLGCAIKPCTVDVYVQYEMVVLGMFDGHEMGGGDSMISLHFKLFFSYNFVEWVISVICHGEVMMWLRPRQLRWVDWQ